MKTIIMALTMLYLCGTSFFVNAQSDPGAGFIENYENGYKHVIDNIDQFEKINSKSSFIGKIAADFGIKGQVKVYSLSEMTSTSGLLSGSNDLRSLFETLNTSVDRSNSYNEFLTALSNFENGASKLADSGEKQYALSYVALFRETMEVTRTQLQFYKKSSNTFEKDLADWWNNWGKCAASVVGGAVMGAIAGAAAGAAAGSVPVPVVGTVSGAIAGAIAGAVGGALTGAATGCD